MDRIGYPSLSVSCCELEGCVGTVLYTPSFMQGAFRLRAPQGPWRMYRQVMQCRSAGSSWVRGNSARITSSILFGWVGVFFTIKTMHARVEDLAFATQPWTCVKPSHNEKFQGAKQQLASLSECFEMIRCQNGAGYMYLHLKKSCQVILDCPAKSGEISFHHTLRPRECREAALCVIDAGLDWCVFPGDIWATPEGNPYSLSVVFPFLVFFAASGQQLGQLYYDPFHNWTESTTEFTRHNGQKAH